MGASCMQGRPHGFTHGHDPLDPVMRQRSLFDAGKRTHANNNTGRLTSFSAVFAAEATLGWGSASTSPRRGTTTGRQEPSCLGAQCAMAPSSCNGQVQGGTRLMGTQ